MTTNRQNQEIADKDLLDAVTYISTLVSDPQAIDLMLDKVRQVTVFLESNDKLSAHDARTVRAVYDEIEQYLITKEPLRSFTRDEVRARLRRHLTNDRMDRTPQLILSVTIFLAGLLGATVFLLPLGQDEDKPAMFYLMLAIPVMFTVLNLGAGWLFVGALRHFAVELRRAYRVIAAGAVAIGLAHLQMSWIGYIDGWEGAWVRDGGVSFVYTPGYVLLYLGTFMFAAKLGIKSRYTSPAAIAVYGLTSMALVAVLPHHTPAMWHEAFFDIGTGVIALGIAVGTPTFILAWRIASKVSDLLRAPIRQYAYALWFLAFSLAQILVVRMAFGYDVWYAQYGIILLPFLIASLLMLRAGYTFNRTSTY